MNFVLYMAGLLLVVGALAYGASRLGVSSTWITIGVLALLGIGIMSGVVKTRMKDSN
jgi:hypothetical protein